MIRVDAQPTPDGELRRQILSKCVEKSEREWWAARTIEKLEFELNAANDRIQSLIEERDRANRLAEWKWNLRDEFQLLLGTDKIEEGIEAVKELKRRINKLEEVAEDLVEQNDIYIRRQEWRKAKEAKPCRYCLRSNCECSDSDTMPDIGDK